MAYQTIYVSNVLESYYRGYDQLPEAEKQAWYRYDSLEANRALLYGADNKVVVTSYPINQEYQADLSKIMSWQNVLNLFPNQPTTAISLDLANNQALRNQLVKIIQENPGINLIQYRSTPEFHELVTFLKKYNLNFNTPELIESHNEFVLNYFNTKRGFRHLWSSVLGTARRDINIPEGFICADLAEAQEAAWWFKSHNRSFVFKYNRGVQGMGVVLNRSAEFAADRNVFLAQVKAKLTEALWQEPVIVVEELIEPDPQILGGSPNVELFITPEGKVEFSFPCEQILEAGKKFVGVYIHPELMKTPQIQAAKSAGEHFGQSLADKGYRGCYDVDMVINHQGQAFAVEANLRRTGGTHIHELAHALLGENYWSSFYIMSLDLKLNVSLTYGQVKALLAEMAWNQNNRSGVLLVNPDLLAEKILIPVLIASNKQAIEALHLKFKQTLKSYLA